MVSDDFVDSASFRDPSGHVYRIDGRIYRTVTDRALDDFEALRASGVYDELAAAGKVIAAEIVEGGPDGPSASALSASLNRGDYS